VIRAVSTIIMRCSEVEWSVVVVEKESGAGERWTGQQQDNAKTQNNQADLQNTNVACAIMPCICSNSSSIHPSSFFAAHDTGGAHFTVTLRSRSTTNQQRVHHTRRNPDPDSFDSIRGLLTASTTTNVTKYYSYRYHLSSGRS